MKLCKTSAPVHLVNRGTCFAEKNDELSLEGRGSLEADNRAGRDGHGLASTGVAAGTGRSALGFKGAEAYELNLFRGNSLGDGGKCGVQCIGGALFGGIRAELLLDGVDKLSLVHGMRVAVTRRI